MLGRSCLEPGQPGTIPIPVSHEIDRAGGLVRIVWEGAVSTDELAALPNRVISDPAWRPGMPILSDARRLTRAFTASELQHHAAQLRELPPDVGVSHYGLVVSEPVMYGLGRMFEIFALGGPLEVRVFYDLAEAERWALGGRSPPDS